MNKRHLYLLAGFLAGIGFILFFYKLFMLDFPLVPEEKAYIWNIEGHLVFEAANKPVKVSMFIPRNSHRFSIIDENFISKGYGVSVAAENGNRRVHWSIRKAKGSQSLYYRATVIRMDRDLLPYKPAIFKQKQPDLEGAYLEASKALIAEVREKSADTDSLVTGLFKRLNDPEPDDSATLLLGKKATVQKKVDLAVQLLALAGIHARAAHGIRLEEQQREAPVVHWLEVYEKDNWISYESASGLRDVPEDYLAGGEVRKRWFRLRG
ncbi:MAG: UUP1 family membrane protein [Desulfobacterales bacterium]|nr:MAG: UUP1 family membrane protein [Desulfobacterales bacterium]